ncbi:MAG: HEAT repeat domain-containing protein, partial [Nocardioidaceae bacterium]
GHHVAAEWHDGCMLVPQLPPPTDLAGTPRDMLAELERHVGTATAAGWCADLLEGADPHDYVGMLHYLGGRATQGVLDGWWGPLYWVRTWGARGLRYVWSDTAAPAVVAGLGDEAWRPAEMCLKVSWLREIGEAGPGAARLIDHELPRVRAAAVRCLGRVGDTEHVEIVEAALDDEHADVRRAAARALTEMANRLDLELDPPDIV